MDIGESKYCLSDSKTLAVNFLTFWKFIRDYLTRSTLIRYLTEEINNLDWRKGIFEISFRIYGYWLENIDVKSIMMRIGRGNFRVTP
jgi:hypothetical protein